MEGPGLDNRDKSAAATWLAAAEKELEKENPGETVLNACLKSMLQIAVGAAGSGLWASIATLLAHFVR